MEPQNTIKIQKTKWEMMARLINKFNKIKYK